MKKFLIIDLSNIDFELMEGNDVLDPYDCKDEGFSFKSSPSRDATIFLPALDNVVDLAFVNINSPSP